MKIDWKKAPKGTTHFDPNELPGDDNRWMSVFNGELYTWSGGDWLLFSCSPEHYVTRYIKRPEYEKSIPKGVITADKLKQLSIDSGLQIEFHPDGMVHVWDEVEEQWSSGTLDEVVELAEAKVAYRKVAAKFTWE